MSTYPVSLSYQTKSDIASTPNGSQVSLSLDATRGQVGVRGTLKNPALWREALMTAIGIFGSDLRYKGKDRTAYLAYLMKQGKKATAAIWEAQKAFLDDSLEEDTAKDEILDPIWTVHPDEVSLEVFSKDESSYARVALSNSLIDNRQASHGTSCVDLSPTFIEELERLRTYAPVSLDAGTNLTSQTKGESRALVLPTKWLRVFLQVQSAATLLSTSCELAPIDLYNLLFVLRTRKAKNPPRGLRFELVPGQKPRMVVEPWEIVLECHGPVYQGKTPRVIRTYGRQRLLALSRLLPYVKGAKVMLLGAGLPLFWVLDLGEASLTLGLTGWTESGWASSASFDALMPSEDAGKLADELQQILATKGPQSQKQLESATGASAEKVRDAVKLSCMRGVMLFDLAKNVYRPRQLFTKALDDAMFRFGSPQESAAHRILKEGTAKLTKVHVLVGEGVELSGEVEDKAGKRIYHPKFTLDLEGRIKDAFSDDPMFKRSGLKDGPSAPLIALRLLYARKRAEEEAMRDTPEARKLIRAETRTLMRRSASGESSVYRVSLDDRSIRIVWGATIEAGRQQKLWFDTDKEARDAYFTKLDGLTTQGYIDAAEVG
jgi:hypothetical protein